MGCNYLSLSEIPTSGTKVLISLTMDEALKTQEHISVKSLLKFKHFYLKKMHLKLSAPTCQPFCLNGLIYVIHYFLTSCTMLNWCWSGVINAQVKYLVTWPSQTVMFPSQHPLVSHSGVGLCLALFWWFSHYRSFVKGFHWRNLMFSLLLDWASFWINICVAVIWNTKRPMWYHCNLG